MGRLRGHPYPDLHQQLDAAGWDHRLTGSGHVEYTAPAGWSCEPRRIVMPWTPTRNPRAKLNTRALVRRALRGQP
jgi:hypothetical protein